MLKFIYGISSHKKIRSITYGENFLWTTGCWWSRHSILNSMEAFYQSAAHFYKEQTGIGNDDYPLRCVTGPTANASTKSVYVVAFLSRGVYS